MSFNQLGRIIQIEDTRHVGNDNSFAVRNFVIEVAGQYPQYVQFQTTQDKCDKLNNFNIGDEVDVSFDLRGKKYIGADKVEKYFTNLNAWQIAAVGNTAPAPVAVATPTTPAAPAPSFDDVIGGAEEPDKLPF